MYFFLQLDGKRTVTDATCNCISGIGKKCKHIYALIHYVNTYRSLSKTAFGQEWGKPSDAELGKDIYAQPLVISDVFKVAETSKSKKSEKCEPVKVYDLT